ncbi:hypothetical protein GCM10011318_14700 [Phaeocystidibacter marisrubri]|nr:hypothetical protein GCM10011318_14700 [Phaeocystidibacter marisrubri]
MERLVPNGLVTSEEGETEGEDSVEELFSNEVFEIVAGERLEVDPDGVLTIAGAVCASNWVDSAFSLVNQKMDPMTTAVDKTIPETPPRDLYHGFATRDG